MSYDMNQRNAAQTEGEICIMVPPFWPLFHRKTEKGNAAFMLRWESVADTLFHALCDRFIKVHVFSWFTAVLVTRKTSACALTHVQCFERRQRSIALLNSEPLARSQYHQRTCLLFLWRMLSRQLLAASSTSLLLVCGRV